MTRIDADEKVGEEKEPVSICEIRGLKQTDSRGGKALAGFGADMQFASEGCDV